MFTEDIIEQMLIDKAVENGWKYVKASEIPRQYHGILVEEWLKESILRLNLGISEEQAEEVIYKIRTAINSVQPHDLVSANERFHELVFEKKYVSIR